MVLAMSRPWKHPVTGVLYFRKKVPEQLRSLVGKREEKRSLGTRDSAEAKRKHALVATEVDRDWQLLLKEPETLSYKQTVALAGVAYRELIDAAGEEPNTPEMWERVELLNERARHKGKLNQWIGPTVDTILRREGLKADDYSRQRLLEETERAITQAARQLKRNAKGDFRPDPDADRFQPLGKSDPKTTLSITAMYEGWAAESNAVDKTRYMWRRIIDDLIAFLGHDDATKVTPDDIIRWKDSLVAKKLQARTINNSKLAPVRSIFQWAVSNRKLPINPADKISVKANSKGDGRRGYNEEETRTILEAALTQHDPSLRWLPWLGAMTGARIAELSQLRGSDVRIEQGIWIISLEWEAGSLKTKGSARKIPIHPVLVQRGFLDFVKAAGTGPLFPTLKPDRFGNRGGTATKRVGRWIRDKLKIDDPRLAPSHSWRHRFKTEARRWGISGEASNVLTGHADGTEASKYGEYPFERLYEELKKLPDPLAQDQLVIDSAASDTVG